MLKFGLLIIHLVEGDLCERIKAHGPLVMLRISVFECFLVVQIWQSTVNSLLELSITHIILVTMDTNTNVIKFGVPILSLIIGKFFIQMYIHFVLLHANTRTILNIQFIVS